MTALRRQPNCKSHDNCQALLELLRKCNIPSSTMPDSCEDILENVLLLYESIAPHNASLVLDFVSEHFSGVEDLVDPAFRESPKRLYYRCPEIGIDMFQPCSVSSCSFYTNNDWSLNCILFYRLKYRKETLSLNELAILLDKDVAALRAKLGKVFRYLGKAALKETIIRDHPGISSPLKTIQGRCAACQASFDEDADFVRRGGFFYCGSSCSSHKPPAVIKTEQEFQVMIKDLLEICVGRFSSTKHMCSAIGVGSKTFMDWCQKYDVTIPPAKLGT